MSEQRKQPNQQTVTWAQAFRDIIVVAMNRGQLPILAVCAIFFILIYKLDADKAFQLLNSFMIELKRFSILGWILWVLTVIAWFFSAKKVRKDFSSEMRRVGREKSKAQEKAADRKLPSSDRRQKPKRG